MAKLALLASTFTLVGALAFASLSSADDDKPAPCKHTEFKTELVKAACAKGGQPEAKNAMKAFNKEKKIKSCNQCHSKLAPGYELKADGLKQFNDLGGK